MRSNPMIAAYMKNVVLFKIREAIVNNESLWWLSYETQYKRLDGQMYYQCYPNDIPAGRIYQLEIDFLRTDLAWEATQNFKKKLRGKYESYTTRQLLGTFTSLQKYHRYGYYKDSELGIIKSILAEREHVRRLEDSLKLKRQAKKQANKRSDKRGGTYYSCR